MNPAARFAATLLVGFVAMFFALPIIAIVARSSSATFAAIAADPSVLAAVRVSVTTSLTAHFVVLALGTPIAYLLSRHRFPGHALLVGFLELPIVLPPAVAGVGLLAAFGRAGLLGGALHHVGVSIPYTAGAVVLAAIFVSGPLYLRQAIAAFDAVDDRQIDAARTLGASPARAFATIAIPLAMPGLEAGSALALARGFGEFGATIMFAGNLPGTTQTLPLAVYSLLDTNLDGALATSILLIVFGISVLVANKVVSAWTISRLR